LGHFVQRVQIQSHHVNLDYLLDVDHVPDKLAPHQVDVLEAADRVRKVVVDGLDLAVEKLELVARQTSAQGLQILEKGIFELSLEELDVDQVVPALDQTALHSDTLDLGLELRVYTLHGALIRL